MTNKIIYLDHAATTPTDPEVVEAMLPYFSQIYGNASGLHRQARASAKAMRESRQTIADTLGCSPKEIVFTSCGSESDNLAVRGVAWAQKLAGKGNHIITSSIEHSAVQKTVADLSDNFGFEQTLLPVDEHGIVNPADVAAAIRPETALISIMYANNEVGSRQPIAEIGEIAHEHGIPFHTDAVQAAAYEPLDLSQLNVDLMAISGHKIYAPKGVGVLFIRNGTPLHPPYTGGSHENKRRPGTENIPYIVGMAKAMSLVEARRSQENAHESRLRDKLIAGVLESVPGSQLTGHPTNRIANHASFVFEGCEADGILMRLDMLGIQGASGSACSTGMPEPSPVLKAMGVPHDLALSALRLTLGRQTTEAHIERVISELPGVIEKLRSFKQAAVAA